MKYLNVIFILFNLILFSQENNSKEIFLYKKYEDYINKNEIYLGKIRGISRNPISYKLKYTNKEGKKKSKAVNNFWGFRIDDKIFRYKKGRYGAAMYVRGVKNKVFYLNGDLIITMIIWDSNYGLLDTHTNLVCYSDSINSKIYQIKKLPIKEKNNSLFKDFIPCIEKGISRYNIDTKFKSLSLCIDSFLGD